MLHPNMPKAIMSNRDISRGFMKTSLPRIHIQQANMKISLGTIDVSSNANRSIGYKHT
jgi:hypothetical protein